MQLTTTTGRSKTNQLQKTCSDLEKRFLVAIPALLLLASVIYFHSNYAKTVVALIYMLCVREILNAASSIAKPIRILSYGFALALLPAHEFFGGQAGVLLLLLFAAMLTFIILIFKERTLTDGFYTILPMLYPGLFFSSVFDILYIPNQQISRFLLIITFGCAIVTDTFGYLGGSTFGRHKLIERVSPNKTVEGAICGFVFGVLFVFVFGSHFQSVFGAHINSVFYVVWGALFSFFSQIGDLSASYLKRWFGVKDLGKIWGPHGGMLDRLDSMLFIAPIASLISMIYLS